MASRRDTCRHQGHIPKDRRTFSLHTKEPREALIRVRKAAVEVDERFAAHRLKLARDVSPLDAELTKEQIAKVEELYFAHLLQEDVRNIVGPDGYHVAHLRHPRGVKADRTLPASKTTNRLFDTICPELAFT